VVVMARHCGRCRRAQKHPRLERLDAHAMSATHHTRGQNRRQTKIAPKSFSPGHQLSCDGGWAADRIAALCDRGTAEPVRINRLRRAERRRVETTTLLPRERDRTVKLRPTCSDLRGISRGHRDRRTPVCHPGHHRLPRECNSSKVDSRCQSHSPLLGGRGDYRSKSTCDTTVFYRQIKKIFTLFFRPGRSHGMSNGLRKARGKVRQNGPTFLCGENQSSVLPGPGGPGTLGPRVRFHNRKSAVVTVLQ